MKRECDKFVGDLSALIDGELTASSRAEIEAHVAGCTDCRTRVAELQKLSAGIAALPKVQPPPEFLADVRRRIAKRDRRPEAHWWIRMIWSPWVELPVKVAAIVAILVGLAALLTPADNTRLNRGQRLDVAQAKKPAEAEVGGEPATLSVATVDTAEMSAAMPAPSASAPAVAFDRADALAKAESKTLSSEGVVADKLQTPVETIVVESPDLAQVQTQAAQVALVLNGRVTSLPPQKDARRKEANNFYVELPARNAGAFREQLLRQNAIVNRQSLAAGQSGVYQQVPGNDGQTDESGALRSRRLGFGGELPTNEPLSVLEIQVVAPVK